MNKIGFKPIPAAIALGLAVGNHRVVYTFSTADSFCFCLNDS